MAREVSKGESNPTVSDAETVSVSGEDGSSVVPSEGQGATERPQIPIQSDGVSGLGSANVGVQSQRPYPDPKAIDWSGKDWFDPEKVTFEEDGRISVRAEDRATAHRNAAAIIAVAGGDFELVKSYDEYPEDEDPRWLVIIRRKA